MSFGPVEEDLVVRALNRRLATATGTEPTQGEPLHILRYAPGPEYKPHLDALPAVANQRHWTALVYLNSGYAGGETAFPELDLAVRGEPGDALVFRNVDAAGRPDPRTRHAGRPVTAGAKWLATRWIRQSAYDPWTGR
jgi:prolyl 4-hydroxylase